MNENIKKLIDQVETGTGGRWVSVDVLEQFAKAIIQECGRIADKSVDYGIPSMDINEHFGD